MRSARLEVTFPKLFAAGYEITSKAEPFYNCIAWAAHDTHRPWWPNPFGYWPFWIKREETLACFVRAFQVLGYRVCAHSRPERGYEKVALYAVGDHPKHMARQLANGLWTSKLGHWEDITHFTLDAVEAYGPPPYGEYGCPVLFMRRLIVISWFVRVIQLIAWRLRVVKNAIKKKTARS